MLCAGTEEGGKDSCEVRTRGWWDAVGQDGKQGWRWGQMLGGKDLLLALKEAVF